MPKPRHAQSPSRPITGSELARKLGLSHATVSYVLNGIGEKRKVSPATIKRVQEAAIEFNCSLDRTARSLKGSSSGMVGVVIGNFKMDWAEYVVNAINGIFDGTDIVPFVATHSFDPERNRKEILSSLRRRDDGIITFPLTGCNDLYESLVETGVPLVFLGDELPEFTKKISSVMWDSRPAIRSAIEHFVSIGRKRIAYLGINYTGLGTLHRFKAFQDALAEFDIPLNQNWVVTPAASGTPEEIVGETLDRLYSHPAETPDAIFCLNDGLAIPALEMLEQRGRSVPEDVAVIGMGNLPLARHPAIGLSTLSEPISEMGSIAASLLLDLIQRKEKAPVRKTVTTSELLVRHSTIG